MSKALIVGGGKGIGLAIAHKLAEKPEIETVYIINRSPIEPKYQSSKFETHIFDLNSDDYSILNQFQDIDILVITAGFGKLALFSDLDYEYIQSSFKVNVIAPIRIIKHYYNKLSSNDNFYCAVMGSITGFMSSPLFSIYGATKSALRSFIESVNVELEKNNSCNKILNVSPGHIEGTSFDKGETNLEMLKPLATEIVNRLFRKDDLFIPKYDEVYKKVLNRYKEDFRAEGRHFYEYKVASGRYKPINKSID